MDERLDALISVRVPAALRDRLEAAATARGQSVQHLVGGIVERFVAEDVGPPDLAGVLRTLQNHADAIRARGVARLWVFGSVARSEGRAGGDVDLMADLDPDARLSLVGLASLRGTLSDLLGAPADLVERATLRPMVRAEAERDAVCAL